jgi:hypothetical protein
VGEVVTERLEFGIPGLDVKPGDHICGFYLGDVERDEMLLPYLRAGIRAGDKCVCLVDTSEPEVVLDRLRDGVDVDACVASDQLEVKHSTDTYLSGGGFTGDDMMAFWKRSIDAAIGPFDFFRAVGEMTWALRDAPGVDGLLAYESELNRFGPDDPQMILCLYDLHRFGGSIVVDLLKTHPKLLLGGAVIENPHHLSADEYAATRE